MELPRNCLNCRLFARNFRELERINGIVPRQPAISLERTRTIAAFTYCSGSADFTSSQIQFQKPEFALWCNRFQSVTVTELVQIRIFKGTDNAVR